MSVDNVRPPDGIASEIIKAALTRPPEEDEDFACDAYALWAAMTRLAHEVKLQGRAFAAVRELLETERWPASAGDADGMEERFAAAVDASLDAFQERAREADRRAEAAGKRAERAEEELATALVDMYDRLARGIEAARTRLSRPKSACGRLRWWLSGGMVPAVLEALAEGQELALCRAVDELARRGYREIPAAGRRFDPETMRATAVDASGRAPDGTVIAVVRSGWMRDEAVWRVAEVTVARRRDS